MEHIQYPINIDYQALNYDNKIIGLGVTYNGIQGYLPCYPSSMLNDVDIKFVDEVEWNNYDTTIQFLTEMKKAKGEILCSPRNKIEEDGLVVGILTETNQFIEINAPRGKVKMIAPGAQHDGVHQFAKNVPELNANSDKIREEFKD